MSEAIVGPKWESGTVSNFTIQTWGEPIVILGGSHTIEDWTLVYQKPSLAQRYADFKARLDAAIRGRKD